ncbi:MAG: hypothetical protein TH68_01525 [Candidatus Synechococcus spongiarum 142]|uniref:Uncharacterized protein n=1 Tax=Candidatus Synechococcus spongiarum 142 TaxID=1608213 RepID=A0A6N3X9Y7_9SYNE|nr:MAG: hypothetical protein TH68_01525 [Candidatus Synechococcus spongiarum 142]
MPSPHEQSVPILSFPHKRESMVQHLATPTVSPGIFPDIQWAGPPQCFRARGLGLLDSGLIDGFPLARE